MLKKIAALAHKLLLKNKMTVALAESCSGGQLSTLLTSQSGASKYFLLGVVTYSNKSKEVVLGIPKKIIIKYGAVSKPVALLMAQNIRHRIHADFGLSITGIAGPTGSTLAKPKGTVYIGLAAKHKNICRKFMFSGGRNTVRKKAAFEALRLLCAHLSQ